jgi:serine-type D-Ala-D-Ala carboxypeptidase/endopeptidase (penicillin-binding protein 4)
MKNLFLLISLLLCTVSLLSQTATKPANGIQTYAETIMADTQLKHAVFGFYVKDMTSGEVIADYNSEMSIPSASTMKLVTTATALQVLGRGYRFKTKIMYSGSYDTLNGTINGDIYLVGGGDPTLGSTHFNKDGQERDFINKWADSLYILGVRKVTGKVIADASIYRYEGVPSGWVWGDMGNYYGAGPSGLTIFDNMLELHFKTGAAAGDSTILHCTTPYVPNISIKNFVRAADSKDDDAYVYGAPYSYDWFVKGTIPKGQEDFVVKASIPDPEFIAALEFDYALEQRGIDVTYAPSTFRELDKNQSFIKPVLDTLLVHESPSLGSIINIVNQQSINLFAEHVLCQISVNNSGYGSTNNGALICTNYWKGKIDATGLFMTDGSGLSRSNAVSAKFFVDLLTYMNSSKSASAFKESMAIAGKRGTMSGMADGTTADGRVYGKSGTMTRIKSFAGYVDSSSGKKLAYAMIINNHYCTSAQLKKYFEQLMIKMSVY